MILRTNTEELVIINQRGREIYETKLRAMLDTPENFRKTVAIDPDSEDYEIDANLIQAVMRLGARHPGKLSYSLRIGKGAGASLLGGRVSKNK